MQSIKCLCVVFLVLCIASTQQKNCQAEISPGKTIGSLNYLPKSTTNTQNRSRQSTPRQHGTYHYRYPSYNYYLKPFSPYYPAADYNNYQRNYYNYGNTYYHPTRPPSQQYNNQVVPANSTVISESTVNRPIRESKTVALQGAPQNNDAFSLPRAVKNATQGTASQRLKATRQLANYQDIKAVATLIDVLVNDAKENARKAAAKSLGEIADPKAYLALMRSEKFDNSSLVRDASSLAIDEIKHLTTAGVFPVDPLLLPMNDGRLELAKKLEILRFGIPQQRWQAVKAIEKFRGTQSVAALVNTLINDPHKTVRKEAAIRLGKMADPLSLPFLESAGNNDPDKSVQTKAKQAIKKIQNSLEFDTTESDSIPLTP